MTTDEIIKYLDSAARALTGETPTTETNPHKAAAEAAYTLGQLRGRLTAEQQIPAQTAQEAS